MIDPKVKLFDNYFRTSRGELNAAEIKTPSPTMIPAEDLEAEIEHYTSLDNIDDVDRIVEAIRELLEKAWGEDCPVLVDEFPTNTQGESVPMPMILYDAFDRKVAENTKKAPNLMGRAELDGDVYELYSQWFDLTLEFQIIDVAVRAVKVLAKRFEVFMQTYAQYFKYLGVGNIYFDSEPKSFPLQIQNQDYVRRTLRYKVRLERRWVKRYGETIGALQMAWNLNLGNGSVQPSGIPSDVYDDIGNKPSDI